MSSFRERVEARLSERERSHLKTSFDVVGDIAILEVDQVLRRKQKMIAQTLLSSQKNLKTVLRKDGMHEGEFRTQKLKFLAGEKKKETVYRESGAQLKLDVEQVYFSPRLGRERLRVAQLVQPGERILVMFSGCAPYPLVIAKNAKPTQIVGVEINPIGHRYGLENLRLNKLSNVILLQGDVRTVIPAFFTREIGLKSHWSRNQLAARLRLKPSLIELHLNPPDLDDHLPELEAAIIQLKEKGIKVMLHAPMFFRGYEQNLSAEDPAVVANSFAISKILIRLCTTHKIHGYVMHAITADDTMLRERFHTTYHNIPAVLSKSLSHANKNLFIENPPRDFFGDPFQIEQILKATKISFCLDLVHLYLTKRTRVEFYESVRVLSRHEPYYHIADTAKDSHPDGARDEHSCSIGEGLIDFSRVIPFIHRGVIEVKSRDETHPREMLDSYRTFQKLCSEWATFDRIVMPLPKGGEHFLDVALMAAKRGAIIHFYDFLHEDDFAMAEKKVARACKKAGRRYQPLQLVKCGQHSPRTYRVCLDFKVL
jgi:tRNA G37 N-methylase Trm5